MKIKDLIEKYEKLVNELDSGYPDDDWLEAKVYEKVINDLKSLVDDYDLLESKYKRLQKAASESVGNAHITNTRLKRVMIDDNN